ncbi:MAG: LytTR family DNA-binding domain-containing protein [Steroidobacteraceae bacterium]
MSSQERPRALAQGVIDGTLNPIRLVRPASPAAPTNAAASRDALELPPAAPGALAVLVGEREHRFYVLKPEQIELIESHGNYVKFHSGGTEYISRDSVKRLAAALSASGFVRIERSLLINVRAIRYAQRAGRGTYTFTLLSGTVVHSGARYRDQILQHLPLADRSHER